MIERIGPIDWNIVDVAPGVIADDRNGECDYEAATIRVCDGLHIQVKDVVTWHERIHAMLYVAGIPAQKHDERLVDAIAHGMAAWMRDQGRGTADAEA